MKTSALPTMAALISNWIAPSTSLPLGAMYSSVPSKVSSSSAPILICSFMPSLTLPTSDSSTWPWKIMSLMSATTAMVVPGLKLLDSITENPTLTGTSMTMPSTVEVTTMLEFLPEVRVAPSLTSCKLDDAASSSWRRSWNWVFQVATSASELTP